jgi:hypothetical protein
MKYLQSACLLVDIIERDGLRNDGTRMVDPCHLHAHAFMYAKSTSYVAYNKVLEPMLRALMSHTTNRCYKIATKYSSVENAVSCLRPVAVPDMRVCMYICMFMMANRRIILCYARDVELVKRPYLQLTNKTSRIEEFA